MHKIKLEHFGTLPVEDEISHDYLEFSIITVEHTPFDVHSSTKIVP